MSWVFPQETEQALAGVRSIEPSADEKAWQNAHRLVRLVDHADLYLSILRSDRWLARHVTVEGRWPERGPFLAAFFHWGAGLWGLRHLSHHRHSAAFLSVHFDRETFRAAPLRYWYARLRAWETGRAAARPLIYTGNAPAQMRRIYRQGHNVTAALDVPLAQTRGSLPARLFERPAWLPKGVIRIAVRLRVPIVVFSMGLNHDTGARQLRISDPISGNDENELAAHFAQILERLIAADSPAWHMWAHVQDFFVEGATAAEPPKEV